MSLYYQDDSVTLHHGDALEVARTLPDGSVDCIVTSPPYFGLRDYGTEGQYGLEASPAEYVETMRALFHELRRVLADDGTLWLNLGDSYSTRKIVRDSSHQPGLFPDRTDHETIGKSWRENAANGNARMPGSYGIPEKNLLGIPWRVAFALQDDGWILRNSIIWAKPNAMPSSVTDRLSTRHENLFLFSKSRRYWFDLDPIREEYSPAGIERRKYAFTDDSATHRAQIKPTGALRDGGTIDTNPLGKNPGDVWTIATQPYPGAHFAVFPYEIPRRCIVAGCKPGGTVLDPFNGSGTTGLAAQNNGRRYVGIDISAEYLELSLKTRLQNGVLDLRSLT